MSRFDAIALRALKASYRLHADPIEMEYADGASQEARGILTQGVELLDAESDIVIRGNTLSCIKTELDSTLRRGVLVTHDGRLWEVGQTIKDSRHEITVEIS